MPAPWIGIALGDVTGIGPEVTLQALTSEITAQPEARFLVLGDAGWLDRRRPFPGRSMAAFAGWDSPPGAYLLDPRPTPLPADLEPFAPAAALAALDWLRAGAGLCLEGHLAALVTAPVCKEAIIRAGHPFVGQTEFLADLARAARTAMMLLGPDERGRWLRVALATTHLPLALVPARLTCDKVRTTIELAADACRALQLPRARIGVCGLNPHAGEGGALGSEEQTVIAPAIEAARARGLDVSGPHAADTLFHRAYQGDFDAVVAMYHDQGLVPLKMVAFDRGVNWTLGLPFVRTSPDHGTAYDLAGQGTADPSSMQAALQLARQLTSPTPSGGLPPQP